MAKGNQQPKPPKYRKDYRASDYLIDHVTLTVDLHESHAEIRSQLRVRANPAVPAPASFLRLDGEELALQSIRLDGIALAPDRYQQDDDSLTLLEVPRQFVLETVVHVAPQNNTRLEGLYKSAGKFCTQCEAEGFRRITFFLDRPDVLATYDVTIRAERATYPHLLGNGNPAGQGELDGGRHFARWQDPFPKPCYLFALVAGDFDLLSDEFVTASGRKVALKIYVDKAKLDQCAHAMASLKASMRWDEEKYGREYDLDIYQIVAVSDFNMGAMENKGLNIFNTKYVLANRDTATDIDYEGVESVIAHEYFHNWTGNRVTCRDWFQLSLKEGLTVFRDQQFSADMGSPTVKRMDDVRVIRTAQFSEDGGPMAHPIRPDSYVEMNNFYTVTVYNKGAEVIRMLHTLLGEAGFRKGMDLYFERNDGKAVTCDDFIAAHAEANSVDLSQFQRWYSQAGTPLVSVTDQFDPVSGEYRLTLKQQTKATVGQDKKEPFLIPFRLGLLDSHGKELPLNWQSGSEQGSSAVLPFKQAEQTFVFRGLNKQSLKEKPLPSLLRDFSAPVKLDYGYSDAQLAFLLQHDSNLFNRWDASQTLGSRVQLKLAADFRAGKALELPLTLAHALRAVLADDSVDNAVRARLLQLPDIAYLQEQVEIVDIDALTTAQRFLRKELALALYDDLLACQQRHRGATGTDGVAIGQRALANACLSLLVESGKHAAFALAEQQATTASNMTDRFAAVKALAHSEATQRGGVLTAFAERFKDEALVMDKWFAVQASAPIASVLDDIRRLERHPAFDVRNPNKVRALWLAFSHNNPSEFHRADGSGYAFVAERVAMLNDSNPQVAARLVSCFNRWKKFDDRRQQLMLAQLKVLLDKSGLSADVFEIVSKSVSA